MKGNGSNGRNPLVAAAVRCQPDSRLVRLVREKHKPAFEEIVRRYRRPLVAFAAGIVPPDHAEDVVQEALTKAHGALGSGDAEINLRPWLYTIVRNRALNFLRDLPVHDHLDENFDGTPQPPEVASRREELASLIAAVQSLPGPQREAIVRRELEGRSHEEIAASLGTTPGAVRGLIYRARTALRDGIGLLIPVPALRAVLGSGEVGSAAAETGGAAAAGLAAGAGGVAMKAGATLGVAVIAVGSGIAIEHRSSRSGETPGAGRGHARSGALATGSGSARVGGGRSLLEAFSSRGPGSGSDDSSGGGENSGPSTSSGSGSSSGPGSGAGSRRDPSSEGSGSGEGGQGASSGSGDDGGASGSGSSGDDGSGSASTGTSSGSGGSGETLASGGSGSSGSGSGESMTTTVDGGGTGTSGSG